MYIKYEDMVSDYLNTVNQIYSFLGIEMDQAVSSWIQSRNTTKSDSDPFSTNRNSKFVTTKWRRKLSFDEVLKIQDDSICGESMKAAKYTALQNKSELTNF